VTTVLAPGGGEGARDIWWLRGWIRERNGSTKRDSKNVKTSPGETNGKYKEGRDSENEKRGRRPEENGGVVGDTSSETRDKKKKGETRGKIDQRWWGRGARRRAPLV